MEIREKGLLLQVRESTTNNLFVHHDCIFSRQLAQVLSLCVYTDFLRPIWVSSSWWRRNACIGCCSTRNFYSSNCVDVILWPYEVISSQLPFLSSCELSLLDVLVIWLKLLIAKWDSSHSSCVICHVWGAPLFLSHLFCINLITT